MSGNLYRKLLQIQKAVAGLGKDQDGDKYKYVSGAKLLSYIRPLMDDLGLLLIPEVKEANFARQDYATSKGSKSEMFCSVKMLFTWVDAESGETLPCEWASSGMNNWDKSLGSSVTYSERYFLLKFFHIQTDSDDVDALSSKEIKTKKEVIKYLKSITTAPEMDKFWNDYAPYYGEEADFKTEYTKRYQEIVNGISK